MKISIIHEGRLVQEIIKKNAYASGLSISNQSSQYDIIDLDNFQFRDSHAYIKRNLPNGSSIEFLILEIDEMLADKYHGFKTMSISLDNIEITAEI